MMIKKEKSTNKGGKMSQAMLFDFSRVSVKPKIKAQLVSLAIKEDILNDKGRASNKNLGRFSLSASKHCQYFTPLELSKALQEFTAEFILPKDSSFKAEKEAEKAMHNKIENDVRNILIPRVKKTLPERLVNYL